MKVERISLTLSSKLLLNDVSFTIPERSLFAILGPNGAGKTLLLKCLAGLLEPNSGTVSGRKQPLAWVPLSQALPFGFLVSDLVLMGRYSIHQGFPQQSDLARVHEAIQAVGIEEFSARPYNSLSRGEQTKVDIARAIASESPVILLDEPFSNLDIDGVLHLIRLFKDLQIEGKTLIFSHHDLFTVSDLATHALLLKKGQVLTHGPLPDVFKSSAIEDAYNVRAILHTHEGHAFIKFQSLRPKS